MINNLHQSIKLGWCWLLFLFFNNINAQHITRYEYFYDTDPGFGLGTSVNLSGNIDATLSIAPPASAGLHTLYFRVQQSDGRWSHKTAKTMLFTSGSGNAMELQKMEYFFDTDPGVGLATQIPVSGNGNFNLNLLASTAQTGLRMLYLRMQDKKGLWHNAIKSPVLIANGIGGAKRIVALEYFFDSDPGLGNGTIQSVSGNGDFVLQVNLNNVLPGVHILHVRTKDSDGIWKSSLSQPVLVVQGSATVEQITKVEYFVDTDPGVGNGTQLTLNAAQPFEAQIFANLNAQQINFLNANNAKLNIRVRNSSNLWSHAYSIDVPPLSASTLNVVEQQNATEIVKIFPNPFADWLHIKIPTKSKLKQWQLYNTAGQIIKESKNSQTDLQLQDIPAGMYLLKIWIDETVITKKVIKK